MQIPTLLASSDKHSSSTGSGKKFITVYMKEEAREEGRERKRQMFCPLEDHKHQFMIPFFASSFSGEISAY